MDLVNVFDFSFIIRLESIWLLTSSIFMECKWIFVTKIVTFDENFILPQEVSIVETQAIGWNFLLNVYMMNVLYAISL